METWEREAKKRGEPAKQRLGITDGCVFLFRDGNWICDPRDKHRDLRMGFGATEELAILDCLAENGLTDRGGAA